MQSTMKALVKREATKGIWMEQVPVPEIGPNEVLVKLEKTAICGTDLHIYKWDEWSQRVIKPGLVIGHEFVGRIVDMGPGVRGYTLGQRVSAEGHIVCGVCRNCRAGKQHLCPNTVGIGVNRAGSKPWLIIQVLLQNAGLDPVKDLSLLQMGGGSQERVAALMRGGIDATLADVLLEPIMKKRGFFVLRGRPTPFMNAPIAFKRSYLASQRSTAKKFVKAFADATRYIIINKPGTLRPLTQLLNTSDSDVIDFAYDYLHANSEATLYPPAEAVENLIKMSGYMDKKLQSINAKQVVDLSLLDELGTKQNERVHR